MINTPDVVQFTPTEHQLQVLQSKSRFILACAGKRGGKCVSKDTLISGHRVDSFGFEKGIDQLYLLGGTLRATAGHIILTGEGWRSVSSLIQTASDQRYAYFPLPALTNGDISLSDFFSGDLSSWKTIQDFQSDYLAYYRSCGGQPQTLKEVGPDGLPLPIGVRARIFSDQYESKHNRTYQFSDPLSTLGAKFPVSRSGVLVDPDDERSEKPYQASIVTFLQSDLPLDLMTKVRQGLDNLDEFDFACVSLILFSNHTYCITINRRITIVPDHIEEYWDTTIPLTHCYEAGGFLNHNTKTASYWSAQQMQIPETQGMIAANTWDQLEQSVMAKFFQEFPQLRKYRQRNVMNIPTGPVRNQTTGKDRASFSKVFLRTTSEIGQIEGLNLHWIWHDEIDGLTMDKWNTLEDRTASTLGQILGTSSIYPRSFLFELARKVKDDPDYEFIHWPSYENPSFSKEEWERLKRTRDPIDFARDFGGEFSFSTGLVYDLPTQNRLTRYPEGSLPVEYIYGLDYGVSDPTVITVSTINTDGNWYIIDEYYRIGMNIQEINHWLEYFIKKYNAKPYATFQDPSGGVARLSLIPDCRPRDAEKHLDERIHLVRDLIFQNRIFCFTNCTYTLKEFDTYSMMPNKDEPEKDKHNHCLDATGMAIEMAWPELEHKAKPPEQQEVMSQFWAGKMEQGIYKGNGMLEDRSEHNNNFDEEFISQGGDEWSEF